ncbi:hypothetical protein MUK42_17712 [Musa troglodytarum]|uniref:Uncharacterized protein n=1 Tax=Musa troglodytarum TaxID=320322 RepID=A0A9E7L508_9LILI|nr:hypothetical protein MUK42_17712 [Musa troglodytarum]
MLRVFCRYVNGCSSCSPTIKTEGPGRERERERGSARASQGDWSRTAAKAASLDGYRSVDPFAGRAAMPAGRVPKPASSTASPVPPAAEGEPSISITSSNQCVHEAATIFTAWVGGGGAGVRPRFVASGPKARVRAHPNAGGGYFQSERCPREPRKFPLGVYFSPSTNFPATEVPHKSAHREASGIIPSMQGQAFSLLQGSPEVQLASDKNVWDAIMKNEKVMEFYRTCMSTVESSVAREAPVADIDSKSLGGEATGRLVIADFVHDVKHKVVETVSNISSFLQELLGTSAGASSSTSTKTSHEDDWPSVNFATGATFLSLAIAAILVVLLKRA